MVLEIRRLTIGIDSEVEKVSVVCRPVSDLRVVNTKDACNGDREASERRRCFGKIRTANLQSR